MVTSLISSAFYGASVALDYYIKSSFLAPLADLNNQSARASLASLYTGTSKVCENIPKSAEKISEYAAWAIEGIRDLSEKSYKSVASYVELPPMDFGVFDRIRNNVPYYLESFQTEDAINNCKVRFEKGTIFDRILIVGMDYFSQTLSYGEAIAKYEYAPHIFGAIALTYASFRLIKKTLKGE